MKKLIPILLAVFALASCEKDPDMGKLDNNYLVYTNYDKKADFKVPTFYLADQILVINDSKEPEYLEGEGAEQILAAYTENMEARGYTAADTKENADLDFAHARCKCYFEQPGYNQIYPTHNFYFLCAKFMNCFDLLFNK